MDSQRFETRAQQQAARLAGLLEMGFERVEGPVVTESCVLPDGRHSRAQSVLAMGTMVSVAALHASGGLLEDAIAAALERMQQLIIQLNRFDESSPVAHLNDSGSLRDAPPELLELLHRSAGMHRLSGGAFDITVQPVVDLLRARRADGYQDPPPGPELHDALSRVDARRVRVQGQTVRLECDGAGITLDGIAKGLIIDRMAAVLDTAGVHDYLINGGGDIRARGEGPAGGAWRVGVQDPDRQQECPDVVAMSSGAVATSGSYEIYFDREQIRHHIVEARTGMSPLECRSVTVRAPSAMHADALATAIFVMGPVQGRRLIESVPGCECFIVTRQRQQLRSSGWAGSVPTASQLQES